MSLAIRKIRSDDLTDFLRLVREFAAFERLTDFCTTTEERFRIALFGETPVAECHVAVEDDILVGYALFYPSFSSFRGERGLYLEDLYLAPKFRGGGNGSILLASVAKVAAERGYERIDFQVLDWNTPAANFYKKLGAEANDQETHFTFGGEAFVNLARNVGSLACTLPPRTLEELGKPSYDAQ